MYYFAKKRLKVLIWSFSTSVLVLISVSASAGEFPRIVFTVPDTTVSTENPSGLLNIYFDNYFDSIAGFQFVLESSRPDLLLFDFSSGGFDSTGTLISGFEFINVKDSLLDGSILKFQCIADLPFQPGITPPFPPQQGGIVVKIPFVINSSPDTTTELLSLLLVRKPFDFSDPNGVSIGTRIDTTYDTTYFQCLIWESDSCLTWDSSLSGAGGFDSISIDTFHFGFLDTTIVIKIDGSVTLTTTPTLTCDNNLSGTIDIADLICLVTFLFGTIDHESCPSMQCDADASGELDIADLVYLVNFMFLGGPPPQ